MFVRNKNYLIHNEDDQGTTKYFGYLDTDPDDKSRWVIVKETTTGQERAWRYATGSGAGSYASNWDNRAALTYNTTETVAL